MRWLNLISLEMFPGLCQTACAYEFLVPLLAKRRRRMRSRQQRRGGGDHLSSFVSVAAILWVVLPVAAAKAFDYKDALSKSLLYFEAQRSGRLPYGQRVTWRGHSGLTDGLQQGVDLVGGYYDAGDHVKFGLPMAFTITMLSWSVIEYGDEIAAAGEYHHALEAIKWGTDYFIKAHTHPYVLWAEVSPHEERSIIDCRPKRCRYGSLIVIDGWMFQVGDGDTDHYCWQRPEDMTTPRQAYKIDTENPGSDVAGETAAAMAAASIVFRKSDKHYSHLLLHHAQRYRGKYDSSIREARSYYPSWSGYEDELLWAAMWLHKATGTPQYMEYVVSNGEGFGGTGWAMTEFSWDAKYAGNFSAAQKRVLKQYESKGEHYICACLNKNNGSNLHRTPGGMLFVRQWNNMQYVSSAAFLLTAYSDYMEEAGRDVLRCPAGAVRPQELVALATSQVDYILGANPMGISYLVGYGRRYAMRVHHRGSSIVSYKSSKGFIGCMQGYYDWYGRRGQNPNVVTGALVGGPDSHDRFRDHRGNYMQTEACTYNTAPLVGVLAKLHQQKSHQHLQEVTTSSSLSYLEFA
ncbi:hypothetical protein BHE74_00012220 [Ensete ventricosum]|nr:hypothetical protein BHE74_00012220 [Ensete ventricosum]